MKKNVNPQRNRKSIGVLLFSVCVICFVAFMGRFTFLMTKGEVNGEKLKAMTEKQYTGSSVLTAKRGTIYDSTNGVIAQDATSYSLYAILDEGKDTPNHVEDKAKTAQILAKYIDMSEEEILATLNQTGKYQVEFGKAGKDLQFSQKVAIENEKLPGIAFSETATRIYPNGVFASHLVGYAEQEKDENGEYKLDSKLFGMMGIEASYNEILSGADGEKTFIKDQLGYAIPGSKINETPAVNGDDIYLTIDKRLQVYLETLMGEVDEKYTPDYMMAIVMKPKTGEILAMSQRPTFDPTTKEGIDQEWRNLLVEETYEPGSTMKVLTLGAAMEQQVFNPNAFYASGSITVADRTFRDNNFYGWGTISYLEGFQRSSNVAFVNLVQTMGYDTWRDYMNEFGLGKTTNSGLYGEESGEIPFEWEPDKAASAFGQSTTVTAMQMAQAFTAVANEGKVMKPYFIKKIVDPNTGEETVTEPTVVSQPISAENAAQELEYMKSVVESPNGTAYDYKIEGQSIAAKTGTAEVAENGNYLTGRENYLYSVVGISSPEDPELMMYVVVKRPKNMAADETGTQVVAQIFNPVMKLAIQYQNMNETTESTIHEVKMPDVMGQTVAQANETLANLGLEVTIVGNGATIVQQIPLPDETVLKGQRIVLMTDGEMTMPDVTTWSKKDILKVSEITGVEFKFEGEGYAVAQTLPAGTVFASGQDDIVISLQKR